MWYGRYPVLRYAIPAALAALGVVVFLPADEPATMTASALTETSPARPSYLVAAPELMAELDAALEASPNLVGETMAREATLPDPSASAEVAVTPEIESSTVPVIDPSKAGYVGGTAVNMRAGPSKSTARLATLQPGQALALGENSNGWVQVTTPDGVSGWVFARYLTGAALEQARQSDPGAEAVAAREPDKQSQQFARHARITSDVVVRSAPSRSAPRLFVLPAGERVGIAEVEGRWARVVLRSGASGWVMIR